MTAIVGQRWYWKTFDYRSEVVFEITAIIGSIAACKYIQIIKKGYPIDYIGYIDRLPIGIIERYPLEYIYLEGQDKPT